MPLTERVLVVEAFTVNNLPAFGVPYDIHPQEGGGVLIYFRGAPEPFFARPGTKIRLNIRNFAQGAIEITLSAIGDFDDGRSSTPR